MFITALYAQMYLMCIADIVQFCDMEYAADTIKVKIPDFQTLYRYDTLVFFLI